MLADILVEMEQCLVTTKSSLYKVSETSSRAVFTYRLTNSTATVRKLSGHTEPTPEELSDVVEIVKAR